MVIEENINLTTPFRIERYKKISDEMSEIFLSIYVIMIFDKGWHGKDSV